MASVWSSQKNVQTQGTLKTLVKDFTSEQVSYFLPTYAVDSPDPAFWCHLSGFQGLSVISVQSHFLRSQGKAPRGDF